jgi:hypothetical protein
MKLRPYAITQYAVMRVYEDGSQNVAARGEFLCICATRAEARHIKGEMIKDGDSDLRVAQLWTREVTRKQKED